MASIDVRVHPDPKMITVRHYPPKGAGAFSTLEILTDEASVAIFVHSRPILDALTAALGEIRAAMDAKDAADQVPSEMADWPVAAENELRAMAGDR